MDTLIAFIKKCAAVFAVAAAAVFLGIPLWIDFSDNPLNSVVTLLEVLTTPAIVIGGVVVWVVWKFEAEIRSVLRRIRKGPFGIELDSAETEKAGLTGSIPAGISLGEIWEKIQAGNLEAQFQLGLAYYFGKGMKEDKEAAVRWWRLSAEQGLAKAQYNLGVVYHKGEGVAQNYAEAVKWFQNAAEQGHAEAQFSLGVVYHKGKGVAQNYAEAVKWYQSAAQQGLAKAQYNLGVAYHKGEGVAQDDAEAVKWYRRAAEQGLAEAKTALESLQESPTTMS